MSSEKYKGAWTPDMGDGGEDEQPASSPPRVHRDHFSNHFDSFRRRQERDRAQAWQQGFEPLSEWNVYNDGKGPPTFILVVEFPNSNHFVAVFEPPNEWGHLMSWCFGCRVRDCAACKWAHVEYVKNIRDVRRNANVGGVAKPSDDGEGLPF